MGKSNFFNFDVIDMAWFARYLNCPSKVDYYLKMKGAWAALPIVRNLLLLSAEIRLSQSEAFIYDQKFSTYDLDPEWRKDLETLFKPSALLQLAVNPLGAKSEIVNAHLSADGERVIAIFTDVDARTQTIERLTRDELVNLIVHSSQLLDGSELPSLYTFPDTPITLDELTRISDPKNPKKYPQISSTAQRIALVLSDLKRRGSVIVYYGFEGDEKPCMANGMVFLAGHQSGACFLFNPMVEHAKGVMFPGSREAFMCRLSRLIDDVWHVPSPEAQC